MIMVHCFLREIYNHEEFLACPLKDIAMAIEFLAVCLILARGFMHLLAFDFTRALVFMIKETLKDMRAFVLVLILAILGFAVLNIIVLKEKLAISTGLTTSFFATYQLLFGENDLVNGVDTVMKRLLFFCATLLLPITVLNLLIAIIGDTYDRIKDI